MNAALHAVVIVQIAGHQIATARFANLPFTIPARPLIAAHLEVAATARFANLPFTIPARPLIAAHLEVAATAATQVLAAMEIRVVAGVATKWKRTVFVGLTPNRPN